MYHKCKQCNQAFPSTKDLVDHYKKYHHEWLQQRASLEGQDVDDLPLEAVAFIILGGMDLGNEEVLKTGDGDFGGAGATGTFEVEREDPVSDPVDVPESTSEPSSDE